jgi:biotin carboxylase
LNKKEEATRMPVDLAYIDLNKNGYATYGVQLAREQGLRTWLISRDPSEYSALDPDPRLYMTGISQADTYNISHLMRRIELLGPNAVIAYDDYRLVQAAIIAREFGLAGPDPRGVTNCRFKDLTRGATSGIGYEVRHAVVPIAADMGTSPLGYPCVVKPIDDGGSMGVFVCRSDDDFVRAVRSAVDHSTHGRAYRCVEAVLVEEFVQGAEYSAEVIWNPELGRWHLLGFAETILRDLPSCQEAAHVFPARLADDTAAKIFAVVEQWLIAVGHRGTAAHVEFKITASGEPALMEINPRLGGGELRRLVGFTLDVDVVDLYQRLWRGLTIKLPGAPASDSQAARKYSVVRYLNPPAAGVVREVSVAPDALREAADWSVTPVGDTGRKVSPESRLGWVITRAASADDAIAEALAFHQATTFEYKS